MACPGCEAVIEEALSALDGVRSVKADFSGNKVTVTYDPGRASFQAMALLLKKKGYFITANETKIGRGFGPDAAAKKGREEKPVIASDSRTLSLR
jgi:copper chaperone CopZ